MTVITVSASASADGFSAIQANSVSGLVAGEALSAFWACRIHSDGKVYGASDANKHNTTYSGSVATYQTDFDGFVLKDVPANRPVTLYGTGLIFNLVSDATLTPGAYLYVSGSMTKGQLSGSAMVNGDIPVCKAVSTSDVRVIREG